MASAAIGSKKMGGVEDIDLWAEVGPGPKIFRLEDDYGFSNTCMSAPNGADLATNDQTIYIWHRPSPNTGLQWLESRREEHEV